MYTCILRTSWQTVPAWCPNSQQDVVRSRLQVVQIGRWCRPPVGSFGICGHPTMLQHALCVQCAVPYWKMVAKAPPIPHDSEEICPQKGILALRAVVRPHIP